MAEFDDHIQQLRSRWEAKPGSRVFLQLAEEYRQRGQLHEAVEVLEKGLAQAPSYLSAQIALGRCRLEAGDAAAARDLLEEVVGRDATQLVANKLLIEAHLQTGNLEQARERLRIYRLLNDSDPEIDGLARRLTEAASAESSSVADEEVVTEVEWIETEAPGSAEHISESHTPEAAASSAEPVTAADGAGDGDSPFGALLSAPAPVASQGTGDLFALERPASPDRGRSLQALESEGLFALGAPSATAAEPPEVEISEGPAESLAAESPTAEGPATKPPAGLSGLQAQVSGRETVVAQIEGDEPPSDSAGTIFQTLAAPLPTPESVEAGEEAAPETPTEGVVFGLEPAGSDAAPPLAVQSHPMASGLGLSTRRSPREVVEDTAPPAPLEPSGDAFIEPPLVEAEIAAGEEAMAAPEPFGATPEAQRIEAAPVAGFPAEEEPVEVEVEAVEVVDAPLPLEVPDSVQAADPAQDVGSGEPATTATLGQLYLQQGHAGEAEKIFRKVLEQEPANPVALAGLKVIGEKARELAADELLQKIELPATAGLTARKIALLEQYLRRIRGTA